MKILDSRTSLWPQFFLLAIIRILTNTPIRMMSPFLPIFARALGVEVSAITLLLGLRALSGTTAPFLANFFERRPRRDGVIGGLIVFALGAAIVVVSPTWTGFAFALLLTAFAKYLMDPAIQAYVGDQVPYEKRGRVTGVIELGWSLSFIIAVPLVGLLIRWRGWAAPFPVFFALALVLLLAVLRWMPRLEAAAGRSESIWRRFRRILRFGPALASLAVGFCIASANEVISVVVGLWLEQAFAVRIAALGLAALTSGLAELVGEGFVGAFTDRLGKKRAIALGTVANCAAGLLLIILGGSLPGAILALFLFYLTFEFTVVSILPLMTQVLPPARATLLGLTLAAMFLGRSLGDFIGPAVFSRGISASVGVAILLNLLTLIALQRVQIVEERTAVMDSPPA